MSNRFHSRIHIITISVAFLVCVVASGTAYAQGTAFTYQGRLTDNGNPADGTFDMQFKLFTTATVGTGTQRGSTITNSMVEVENGVLSVQLNFGVCPLCFDGSARFLEIGIRPAGSMSPYTVLSPRQPVTSTPYAIRSAEAASADLATNAEQLDGIGASGFIQNTTMQQIMTNFNISGNGTIGGMLSAGTINAGMQYDIGGQRVFSIAGTDNVIAGKGAGVASPDGSGNSFFGFGAGAATQMGNNNAFFGRNAGALNTVSFNSFFGSGAGDANTTGTPNAFFGFNAGGANQTGNDNAFFGASAGSSNQIGNNNAFFGRAAGAFNTASNNAFFGAFAGNQNTTGTDNAFFGLNAGRDNQTGDGNSFFGASAGSNTTASNNSFFGSGAGQDNISGINNSFFGAFAGEVNLVDDNSFFGAAAGFSNTFGTANSFFGRQAGLFNAFGNGNSFFGFRAGFDTTASGNSFFGNQAGDNNSSGADNSFFGALAGDSNDTGSDNTVIGALADVGSGALTFATAIGAGAVVNNSASVVLGRAADTVRIPGSLNISTLGAATATHLCINAGLVSNCSSSLRYKDQLAPFTAGLELINRLRPITFNWKTTGERDLGLAAEAVAAVEPLLVTYNERGQVEGVKYDRINIALINAVREQQAQIQRQKDEIIRQRSEIDEMKKVVCQIRPDASVCR